MTMQDLYEEHAKGLTGLAASFGLDVSINDNVYPVQVEFHGADMMQVGLFPDVQKSRQYMTVTVWPEQSSVDLNLYGINNKDLTKLVKEAEKTVIYYLHAFREGADRIEE